MFWRVSLVFFLPGGQSKCFGGIHFLLEGEYTDFIGLYWFFRVQLYGVDNLYKNAFGGSTKYPYEDLFLDISFSLMLLYIFSEIMSSPLYFLVTVKKMYITCISTCNIWQSSIYYFLCSIAVKLSMYASMMYTFFVSCVWFDIDHFFQWENQIN